MAAPWRPHVPCQVLGASKVTHGVEGNQHPIVCHPHLCLRTKSAGSHGLFLKVPLVVPALGLLVVAGSPPALPSTPHF